MPDAGGLVIASDQESAKAYAKILRAASRARRRRVVLSDDPKASGRIAEFAATNGALDGGGPDGLARASTCRGWRSACTRRARRRRCSSRRRSAGSCGRGGRARRPACSCRSVPVLLELASELEARARPRAGQAAPGEGRLGRRAARRRQPHQGRAGRGGEGVHLAGRLGRARPGDLRRLLVRHGGVGSAPTRSRTTSACPACWSPTRCGRCCASGRRSSVARREAPQAGEGRRPAPAGAPAVGERAARRAAQGAERAGRHVPPPHRRSRTARSTASCGESAAARRPRWRPSSSSRNGSPRCVPGDARLPPPTPADPAGVAQEAEPTRHRPFHRGRAGPSTPL